MRLAVIDDVPGIGALMRASATELFPLFYTEHQAASAVTYLTEPDITLIEDGTYYVHEADGEIVACGGWSKRNKLYTGSGARDDDGRLLDPGTEPARVRAMFVRKDWTRRGLARTILDKCAQAAYAQGFRSLSLMATLPGVPLYRAYGFAETRRTWVPLPDGVELEGVEMTYELHP
ncbi:GNAT family N-acetyltransferase [Kibdelosporangium persicum]|uniref:N-acetyltransferase n=1 Tax=Kibdelosporangium persicum TaxID=2698649 RepID=A0ABX2F1E4_9PSEU|nr:GNAT family N-acetyltransferase [Kibdelosporangium persicum]NRN65047.1 N-acetyltransferase [Kibdelosporangium persicum]